MNVNGMEWKGLKETGWNLLNGRIGTKEKRREVLNAIKVSECGQRRGGSVSKLDHEYRSRPVAQQQEGTTRLSRERRISVNRPRRKRRLKDEEEELCLNKRASEINFV
ncbi:hypothetical protein R1flu_025119 [Riccia fluitans]|uniref:Uncharacterized protein n=1 Tax=Riccia fluitans TaxID=41844 RepID=A0ABD1XWV7_9MARC